MHCTKHKELYVLESLVILVSHLVRFGTLAKNETDVLTICISYFFGQCDKNFSKHVFGFSLHNATFFLQQVTFISTMLLPNAPINANWDVH